MMGGSGSCTTNNNNLVQLVQQQQPESGATMAASGLMMENTATAQDAGGTGGGTSGLENQQASNPNINGAAAEQQDQLVSSSGTSNSNNAGPQQQPGGGPSSGAGASNGSGVLMPGQQQLQQLLAQQQQSNIPSGGYGSLNVGTNQAPGAQHLQHLQQPHAVAGQNNNPSGGGMIFNEVLDQNSLQLGSTSMLGTTQLGSNFSGTSNMLDQNGGNNFGMNNAPPQQQQQQPFGNSADQVISQHNSQFNMGNTTNTTLLSLPQQGVVSSNSMQLDNGQSNIGAEGGGNNSFLGSGGGVVSQAQYNSFLQAQQQHQLLGNMGGSGASGSNLMPLHAGNLTLEQQQQLLQASNNQQQNLGLLNLNSGGPQSIALAQQQQQQQQQQTQEHQLQQHSLVQQQQGNNNTASASSRGLNANSVAFQPMQSQQVRDQQQSQPFSGQQWMGVTQQQQHQQMIENSSNYCHNSAASRGVGAGQAAQGFANMGGVANNMSNAMSDMNNASSSNTGNAGFLGSSTSASTSCATNNGMQQQEQFSDAAKNRQEFVNEIDLQFKLPEGCPGVFNLPDRSQPLQMGQQLTTLPTNTSQSLAYGGGGPSSGQNNSTQHQMHQQPNSLSHGAAGGQHQNLGASASSSEPQQHQQGQQIFGGPGIGQSQPDLSQHPMAASSGQHQAQMLQGGGQGGQQHQQFQHHQPPASHANHYNSLPGSAGGAQMQQQQQAGTNTFNVGVVGHNAPEQSVAGQLSRMNSVSANNNHSYHNQQAMLNHGGTSNTNYNNSTSSSTGGPSGGQQHHHQGRNNYYNNSQHSHSQSGHHGSSFQAGPHEGRGHHGGGKSGHGYNYHQQYNERRQGSMSKYQQHEKGGGGRGGPQHDHADKGDMKGGKNNRNHSLPHVQSSTLHQHSSSHQQSWRQQQGMQLGGGPNNINGNPSDQHQQQHQPRVRHQQQTCFALPAQHATQTSSCSSAAAVAGSLTQQTAQQVNTTSCTTSRPPGGHGQQLQQAPPLPPQTGVVEQDHDILLRSQTRLCDLIDSSSTEDTEEQRSRRESNGAARGDGSTATSNRKLLHAGSSHQMGHLPGTVALSSVTTTGSDQYKDYGTAASKGTRTAKSNHLRDISQHEINEVVRRVPVQDSGSYEKDGYGASATTSGNLAGLERRGTASSMMDGRHVEPRADRRNEMNETGIAAGKGTVTTNDTRTTDQPSGNFAATGFYAPAVPEPPKPPKLGKDCDGLDADARELMEALVTLNEKQEHRGLKHKNALFRAMKRLKEIGEEKSKAGPNNPAGAATAWGNWNKKVSKKDQYFYEISEQLPPDLSDKVLSSLAGSVAAPALPAQMPPPFPRQNYTSGGSQPSVVPRKEQQTGGSSVQQNSSTAGGTAQMNQQHPSKALLPFSSKAGPQPAAQNNGPPYEHARPGPPANNNIGGNKGGPPGAQQQHLQRASSSSAQHQSQGGAGPGTTGGGTTQQQHSSRGLKVNYAALNGGGGGATTTSSAHSETQPGFNASSRTSSDREREDATTTSQHFSTQKFGTGFSSGAGSKHSSQPDVHFSVTSSKPNRGEWGAAPTMAGASSSATSSGTTTATSAASQTSSQQGTTMKKPQLSQQTKRKLKDLGLQEVEEALLQDPDFNESEFTRNNLPGLVTEVAPGDGTSTSAGGRGDRAGGKNRAAPALRGADTSKATSSSMVQHQGPSTSGEMLQSGGCATSSTMVGSTSCNSTFIGGNNKGFNTTSSSSSTNKHGSKKTSSTSTPVGAGATQVMIGSTTSTCTTTTAAASSATTATFEGDDASCSLEQQPGAGLESGSVLAAEGVAGAKKKKKKQGTRGGKRQREKQAEVDAALKTSTSLCSDPENQGLNVSGATTSNEQQPGEQQASLSASSHESSFTKVEQEEDNAACADDSPKKDPSDDVARVSTEKDDDKVDVPTTRINTSDAKEEEIANQTVQNIKAPSSRSDLDKNGDSQLDPDASAAGTVEPEAVQPAPAAPVEKESSLEKEDDNCVDDVDDDLTEPERDIPESTSTPRVITTKRLEPESFDKNAAESRQVVADEATEAARGEEKRKCDAPTGDGEEDNADETTDSATKVDEDAPSQAASEAKEASSAPATKPASNKPTKKKLKTKTARQQAADEKALAEALVLAEKARKDLEKDPAASKVPAKKEETKAERRKKKENYQAIAREKRRAEREAAESEAQSRMKKNMAKQVQEEDPEYERQRRLTNALGNPTTRIHGLGPDSWRDQVQSHAVFPNHHPPQLYQGLLLPKDKNEETLKSLYQGSSRPRAQLLHPHAGHHHLWHQMQQAHQNQARESSGDDEDVDVGSFVAQKYVTGTSSRLYGASGSTSSRIVENPSWQSRFSTTSHIRKPTAGRDSSDSEEEQSETKIMNKALAQNPGALPCLMRQTAYHDRQMKQMGQAMSKRNENAIHTNNEEEEEDITRTIDRIREVARKNGKIDPTHMPDHPINIAEGTMSGFLTRTSDSSSSPGTTTTRTGATTSSRQPRPRVQHKLEPLDPIQQNVAKLLMAETQKTSMAAAETGLLTSSSVDVTKISKKMAEEVPRDEHVVDEELMKMLSSSKRVRSHLNIDGDSAAAKNMIDSDAGERQYRVNKENNNYGTADEINMNKRDETSKPIVPKFATRAAQLQNSRAGGGNHFMPTTRNANPLQAACSAIQLKPSKTTGTLTFSRREVEVLKHESTTSEEEEDIMENKEKHNKETNTSSENNYKQKNDTSTLNMKKSSLVDEPTKNDEVEEVKINQRKNVIKCSTTDRSDVEQRQARSALRMASYKRLGVVPAVNDGPPYDLDEQALKRENVKYAPTTSDRALCPLSQGNYLFEKDKEANDVEQDSVNSADESAVIGANDRNWRLYMEEGFKIRPKGSSSYRTTGGAAARITGGAASKTSTSSAAVSSIPSTAGHAHPAGTTTTTAATSSIKTLGGGVKSVQSWRGEIKAVAQRRRQAAAQEVEHQAQAAQETTQSVAESSEEYVQQLITRVVAQAASTSAAACSSCPSDHDTAGIVGVEHGVDAAIVSGGASSCDIIFDEDLKSQSGDESDRGLHNGSCNDSDASGHTIAEGDDFSPSGGPRLGRTTSVDCLSEKTLPGKRNFYTGRAPVGVVRPPVTSTAPKLVPSGAARGDTSGEEEQDVGLVPSKQNVTISSSESESEDNTSQSAQYLRLHRVQKKLKKRSKEGAAARELSNYSNAESASGSSVDTPPAGA
ncbi:unnamed protein product [Amoebophrya sp. A120]|nr:unnamed protein product [Amoebophrya sp. A120]|eukprot:GSA120T00002228001.1